MFGVGGETITNMGPEMLPKKLPKREPERAPKRSLLGGAKSSKTLTFPCVFVHFGDRRGPTKTSQNEPEMSPNLDPEFTQNEPDLCRFLGGLETFWDLGLIVMK